MYLFRSSFDVDDDRKYLEDEGLQAMKDIDNFDKTWLKYQTSEEKKNYKIIFEQPPKIYSHFKNIISRHCYARHLGGLTSVVSS